MLTHTKGDEAKEKITQIDRFHVEQYAYVIRRLSETVEGDGTLLDHSCVVMGSGISDGDKHNHADLQVLLRWWRDEERGLLALSRATSAC